MRLLVALGLFASVVATLAVSQPGITVAQEKKDDKKKVQPKADPKTFIPDEATLKTIKEKTETLRGKIQGLVGRRLPDDVVIEVEIYLKAVENIVRFEEWLHKDSVKWALQALEQGSERARLADDAPWQSETGKWVVRAYRSRVDGSIQPYAVLLPHDFYKDPLKRWRLDIVLHGRDGALTEAKFLATHGGAAPKGLDHVQLEVYGRGNNAYRWAGETDVFEAAGEFSHASAAFVAPADEPFKFAARSRIDPRRMLLRGFSMGGAGTWHIGLHNPSSFCAIGPGAGFTTTHGYIANLPKELPDYQEKCLRIYDAVDYAENAFNVPVVAYSGEIDAQKKAADNIEALLKNFKEPHKFTHLVAPGLAHSMPKEWQEKAEVEYRKYADKGRNPKPERIRFVTYTPRFGRCDWLNVLALDTTYEKATVDATRDGDTFTVTTSNVRQLSFLRLGTNKDSLKVTIDGQEVNLINVERDDFPRLVFDKVRDKWVYKSRDAVAAEIRERPRKDFNCVGPIDDAFRDAFVVVRPDRAGWHPGLSGYATTALEQFESVWDRYFRGKVRVARAERYIPEWAANLVLFGDPESNRLIGALLPKLPITWTKEKLVVNGVEYDSKTHVPVLIYPNPMDDNRTYVVINSGHTFKEADLKGTNALLYPRLGDWAVIKPTPTEKDPAAYEVVAAGLFDENWQFPKKKMCGE